MNIQQITATEVIVPAQPGAIESEGMNKPLHKLPVGAQKGWSAQFDQLPKLILKMELDNGIVGWGELYRGHQWPVVDEMVAMLLGQDIRSLCLQDLPFAYSREYDGFECAIWDAYAKVHDLRVVDLLGGPVRNRVKIGAWSSHRQLDEIGPLAKKFADQGYDCLKFKCDLDDNVAGWCQAIQEASPGMQVILDPNERWHFSGEVRQRLDSLRKLGNVLCLEDPLPRWMLHEYAYLRNFSSVPIVLHVSLPYVLHGQRIEDMIKALKADAVDGFNLNAGLADFQRLDHVATAAGLPCWHGSEVDLGILEAMYVHSAAAAKSCIWPSDIFGRLIRSHDLLKEPLDRQPPFITLPNGPGLGVEPDEEAIQQYQVNRKEYTL